MASAARALVPLLRHTDVILEVRDARLPFSSANPALRALAGSRPRVIVLNKADLADGSLEGRVRAAIEFAERAESRPGSLPPTVVFARADAGARGGAAAVVAAVDKALDVISRAKKNTTSTSTSTLSGGATLAVIGVPNVGKSSLINALRCAAAAAGDSRAGRGELGSPASVAPEPGHTRCLRAVRVRGPPVPLWIWDAPGVAEPRLRGVEHGLKLTVAACVRGAAVPIAVQAEYLLFAFNTLGVTEWARVLGLKRAYDEDEIRQCLQELALVMGVRRGGSGENEEEEEEDVAARILVRAWQSGKLGRFTLDFVPSSSPFPEKAKAKAKAKAKENNMGGNGGRMTYENTAATGGKKPTQLLQQIGMTTESSVQSVAKRRGLF
jgi:ribosome biogenesis GTPase A